jgi:very-short-patch-repair endonuclease
MRGLGDEHPGELWRHGVASRRELLAAGVGARAIEHRLRTGRYLRVHEGVYAIGHGDLTVAGRRRAIVLACGPGAVLSHRSAAGAWGLRPDHRPMWEVTIRTASRRRPAAAVAVHRHPSLPADEVTDLDAVPITTVARTLLDLAAVVPAHHLRRAVQRADDLQIFDLAALRATLAAHRRRPGTPVLRALLSDLEHHGQARTRSDLEALFLQLCLDQRLARPHVNHHTNGRELDFTWPAQALVVEIDSWRHHRSRTAFDADRARDRQSLAEGLRVARFTDRQLTADPVAVARELRRLLAPPQSAA